MINFAVINFKSTIKNLFKIIIVLLLIIGIVNLSDLIKNFNVKFSYIGLIKSNLNFEFNENQENYSLAKTAFYQEMPILASGNNINEIKENNENNNENIVAVENNKNDIVSNDEQPEAVQTSEVQENTNLRNLPTEVIHDNNLSENYNTLYGDVKIKNETSFTLTEDILTPNVEFTNKTDVVIFHTHTCESYTRNRS